MIEAKLSVQFLDKSRPDATYLVVDFSDGYQSRKQLYGGSADPASYEYSKKILEACRDWAFTRFGRDSWQKEIAGNHFTIVGVDGEAYRLDASRRTTSKDNAGAQ